MLLKRPASMLSSAVSSAPSWPRTEPSMTLSPITIAHAADQLRVDAAPWPSTLRPFLLQALRRGRRSCASSSGERGDDRRLRPRLRARASAPRTARGSRGSSSRRPFSTSTRTKLLRLAVELAAAGSPMNRPASSARRHVRVADRGAHALVARRPPRASAEHRPTTRRARLRRRRSLKRLRRRGARWC